jgi:hypothetical protein
MITLHREQHNRRLITFIDGVGWRIALDGHGVRLIEIGGVREETAEDMTKADQNGYITTSDDVQSLFMHFTTEELADRLLKAAEALALPPVTGRDVWTRSGRIFVGSNEKSYEFSVDIKDIKHGTRKDIQVGFARIPAGDRYPYQDIWLTREGDLGFPVWKVQSLVERWAAHITKIGRMVRPYKRWNQQYYYELDVRFKGYGAAPIVKPRKSPYSY